MATKLYRRKITEVPNFKQQLVENFSNGLQDKSGNSINIYLEDGTLNPNIEAYFDENNKLASERQVKDWERMKASDSETQMMDAFNNGSQEDWQNYLKSRLPTLTASEINEVGQKQQDLLATYKARMANDNHGYNWSDWGKQVGIPLGIGAVAAGTGGLAAEVLPWFVPTLEAGLFGLGAYEGAKELSDPNFGLGKTWDYITQGNWGNAGWNAFGNALSALNFAATPIATPTKAVNLGYDANKMREALIDLGFWEKSGKVDKLYPNLRERYLKDNKFREILDNIIAGDSEFTVAFNPQGMSPDIRSVIEAQTLDPSKTYTLLTRASGPVKQWTGEIDKQGNKIFKDLTRTNFGGPGKGKNAKISLSTSEDMATHKYGYIDPISISQNLSKAFHEGRISEVQYKDLSDRLQLLIEYQQKGWKDLYTGTMLKDKTLSRTSSTVEDYINELQAYLNQDRNQMKAWELQLLSEKEKQLQDVINNPVKYGNTIGYKYYGKDYAKSGIPQYRYIGKSGDLINGIPATEFTRDFTYSLSGLTDFDNTGFLNRRYLVPLNEVENVFPRFSFDKNSGKLFLKNTDKSIKEILYNPKDVSSANALEEFIKSYAAKNLGENQGYIMDFNIANPYSTTTYSLPLQYLHGFKKGGKIKLIKKKRK